MDRVDRVQIAVKDANTAAATFARLLGTEIIDRKRSTYLGAKRTILAMGESQVELCEPAGSGKVADFLAARGEGLMTAGVSCAEPDRLRHRLEGLNYSVIQDDNQFYLPGEEHFGVSFVISESRSRNRVGPVSFLFEVTNTLESDWRLAAAHYAGIFNLDPHRFCPISSEGFGYEGTLTMFNTPNQLDRLELSQVVRPDTPMGRWIERFGNSLYMCSCESHDIDGLIARFRQAGARWIPRGGNPDNEHDGLWTHPADLHGLLMGVARTTVAWGFSGHPEFVDPPAKVV